MYKPKSLKWAPPISQTTNHHFVYPCLTSTYCQRLTANKPFLFLSSRYSRKTDHTNPYAREEVAWRGSNNRTVAEHGSMIQTVSGNDSPYGGWQEENRRGRENIPMGLISTQPGTTPWQNDLSEWHPQLWL